MADNLTKVQRSHTMSVIRSKWTLQEKKIHNYLKSRKIRHEMHPDLSGRPDLIIPGRKIAVFLHGCFWHKCPKHYQEPKSNKSYWLPKIRRNCERDKKNMQMLRKSGWHVVRIWEHEVKKDAEKCLSKIINS